MPTTAHSDNTLRLPVTQLAAFGQPMAVGGNGGAEWRAELGRHWHQQLQEQTAAQDNDWEFETAVSGTLVHRSWRFLLSGRMDQVHLDAAGRVDRIREVKSVLDPLPLDPSLIRKRHASWLHQLILYGWLTGDPDAELPPMELVVVEAANGTTQTLAVEPVDIAALRSHLDAVVQQLDDQQQHRAAIARLSLAPPFARLRQGQDAALENLSGAIRTNGLALFEAPTGFGKSGMAIHTALSHLLAGDVERVLLLSCKTTGQIGLLRHLQQLKKDMPALRCHAQRSRVDLYVEGEENIRLYPAEIMERWRSAGNNAAAILEATVPDVADIKRIAAGCGLPPWVVSRILLSAADVWVADVNYLFDTAVASVFDNLAGFIPSRTFLVIDEAHNLSGRVESAHSWHLDRSTLESVLTDLRFHRCGAVLERAVDLLLSRLKKQPVAEQLDPPDQMDLIDSLQAIVEQRHAVLWNDELSDATTEWMMNLSSWLRNCADDRLHYLFHAPQRGVIRADCIDASTLVRQILQRFGPRILMSATMRPWEEWSRFIGTHPEPSSRVHGAAPWIDQCFTVVVDARADTRFHQRQRSVAITAATIARTHASCHCCLPVFMPSYAYAHLLHEQLRRDYPLLRCDLQPRDLAAAEQVPFLESGLLLADVLLLILGSRFSEGIDILGGRVSHAIVVSPALPEVNARQRAREQLAKASHDPFAEIYIHPGMRKVIQAVGRMVREPSHRVNVLLHCQRFASPAYQRLLPEHLQPKAHLLCDEDFELHWLKDVAID